MREELIKYRKKLKKSQENMAKTLDISVSFYKQIEYEYRNPSLEMLKKFHTTFPNANIVKIFLA